MGSSYMYAGILSPFYCTLEESQKIYEKGFYHCGKAYDYQTLGYLSQNLVIVQAFFGYEIPKLLQNIKEISEKYLSKIKLTRNDFLVSLWGVYKSQSYLFSRDKKPQSLLNITITQEILENSPSFNRFAYYYHLMISYFYLEDYKEAIKLDLLLTKILMPGIIISFDYYFYSPLIRSFSYTKNDDQQQDPSESSKKHEIIDYLSNCIEKLELYNKISNVFYSRLLILKAERLFLIKQKSMKIFNYLNESFTIAKENNLFHIAGIAAERNYFILLKNQFSLGLESCIESSYKMNKKWGAFAKCKILHIKNKIKLRKITSPSIKSKKLVLSNQNINDSAIQDINDHLNQQIITKKDSTSENIHSSSMDREELSIHNLVLHHVTDILNNNYSTNHSIYVFTKIILQHDGADKGIIFYKYQNELYVISKWDINGMETFHLPNKKSKKNQDNNDIIIIKASDYLNEYNNNNHNQQLSNLIPSHLIFESLKTGETITINSNHDYLIHKQQQQQDDKVKRTKSVPDPELHPNNDKKIENKRVRKTFSNSKILTLSSDNIISLSPSLHDDYDEDLFANYKVEGSICCIPMKVRSETLGVIFLENTLLKAAFPEQHRVMLEHLGCQIVSIIERNLLNKNLKKTLNKVQKKAAILESMSKMKDDFVASTSHELRTPLNAVLGFSEILKETSLSDEQQEYCNMIYSSAEGLLSVINDILDFQRCQKDTLELESSFFDFRKCIDHILRLIVVQCGNIELILSYDNEIMDDTWIECDRLRLQQILLNLLSNAMKFTSSGNITLEIKIENNLEIIKNYPESIINQNQNQIKNSDQNFIFDHKNSIDFKVFKISVTDTGIGIDPSKYDCLFKPFSQLDSGTTRKYTGTGLGLTISQNLVHLLSHGSSKIEFDSTLGKGTCFYFYLPVRIIPSINPQVNELSRRQTSQELLKGSIFVIFMIDPKTKSFFLNEIKSIHTFMKRFTDSFESTKSILSNLRNSYPNKNLFCFIDINNNCFSFTDDLILQFIKDIRILSIDVFIITHINQRNHYHSCFIDTNLPISIITKPFYKDHIINTIAASLQKKLSKNSNSPLLKPNNNGKQDQISPIPFVTDEIKLENKKEIKSSPKLSSNQSLSDDLPNILMVEDNKMNQKVQTTMLRLKKLTCDVAVNGRIGVEMYKERLAKGVPYTLILMDFHMPEMDGKEATRNIRAFEKENNIPPTHIVGLTADSEKDCSGMCTIISKPIKKIPFHAAMDEYLKKPCDCAKT